MITRLILALLVGLISLPASAAAPQSDGWAPKGGWNVLLITVDCLRPDHMGVYGYQRDTTPHLAQLAEESFVFDSAFSNSAWTSPGIVSLLTGYYPPVHGQNSRLSFYDAAMDAPLRVLAERGYQTFGRAAQGPTYADLGIGFELKPFQSLEEVIGFRQRKNRPPFLAWAHLKHPHLPYDKNPQDASRWGADERSSAGIEAVREHHLILRGAADVPYTHAGEVAFSEDDAPAIRALYDAEVAEVDRYLGEIVEQMRQVGILDDTILVITADHGEELLEHGWVGHASTSYDGKLYDELIRIPLILRLPDTSLTGRSSAMVQQVDLMPTLFDLLGADDVQLKAPMQGRSLVPLMKGEQEQVSSLVFAETTRKGWTTPKSEVPIRVTAVRSTTMKLHRIPDGAAYRYEGYDLQADPGETQDLFASQPERFAPLMVSLEQWDAENRALSAELVLGAARSRAEAVQQNSADGDVLAVLREYRALLIMAQTWGLERDPFFLHAPYQAEWEQLQRQAAKSAARAVRKGP